MSWQQLGIPPETAQFLETRQFQVVEICRWYRMPPHKVQDLSGAKYANVEQQNLEYVTDTLMPWTIRWEQQLKRKLFADDPEHFAEHLLLGLLRGDQAARSTFYKELFGLAAISPNDIREAENFNPLGPDGDTYFVATNNYTPLKFAVREDPDSEAENDTEETQAEEDQVLIPTLPGRNGVHHNGYKD
jgi:phage portal protein BeeE